MTLSVAPSIESVTPEVNVFFIYPDIHYSVKLNVKDIESMYLNISHGTQYTATAVGLAPSQIDVFTHSLAPEISFW